MTTTPFEVENPEAKSTLREISDKIKHALPKGWGFLLMLFEYGTPENPGAMFYASSAERDGVIRLVREWLAHQGVDDAQMVIRANDEINPNHPMTKQMRENWHKIVALLLMKLTAGEGATITTQDLQRLAARDVAVAVKDTPEGLNVFIVDTEEARRLAAAGLAEEGQRS